jgi:uroporphyrinogen-III synthase
MKKPVYLFSTSSHPDANSINSLDIKYLHPNINFSKYDYLIITSKQASKALNQYEKKEYITKKALCISEQSAKSFESLGGTILDIGKGYGDTLANKIKSYPKASRWLYLRASIVASNFVEICQNDGYNIEEKVLYESECSAEIHSTTLEDNAVLIFTSPSSVECFLKNSIIKKTQQIIVIGTTTAKALPENTKYRICEDKTIDNCIEIAKNL